ncbi:hypothetical protein FPV67DRAFT_1460809 [Lyophyllum atratum]|nr:hypothetical protein FPV67DRAFT_1460809 [Lyophyllum atratum]
MCRGSLAALNGRLCAALVSKQASQQLRKETVTTLRPFNSTHRNDNLFHDAEGRAPFTIHPRTSTKMARKSRRLKELNKKAQAAAAAAAARRADASDSMDASEAPTDGKAPKKNTPLSTLQRPALRGRTYTWATRAEGKGWKMKTATMKRSKTPPVNKPPKNLDRKRRRRPGQRRDYPKQEASEMTPITSSRGYMLILRFTKRALVYAATGNPKSVKGEYSGSILTGQREIIQQNERPDTACRR